MVICKYKEVSLGLQLAQHRLTISRPSGWINHKSQVKSCRVKGQMDGPDPGLRLMWKAGWMPLCIAGTMVEDLAGCECSPS